MPAQLQLGGSVGHEFWREVVRVCPCRWWRVGLGCDGRRVVVF
jgi:hypothetical protein